MLTGIQGQCLSLFFNHYRNKQTSWFIQQPMKFNRYCLHLYFINAGITLDVSWSCQQQRRCRTDTFTCFCFLRQTEELLWQNLEDTEVTVRRNDGECLRHWTASVIMAMTVAAVMKEKSQELTTELHEIERNTQIKLQAWEHKNHLSHYKGYCSHCSYTRCIQQHPQSSTPKITFSSLLIPLKEQGHHDTAKCSASA